MQTLWAIGTVLVLAAVGTAAEPKPFPGKISMWQGFTRHDFQVDGAQVIVVAPAKPLSGRPWAWRGEFFGAFPNADVELVKGGWHLAYMSVPDLFGAPRAVARWEKFYEVLVKGHGLHPKPGLIGLSRGALYCMAWAAAHPDKTLAVYLDNGVCDFKSWPGGRPKGLGTGQGSAAEWAKLLKAYGFKDDKEAIASKVNPVDNLAPLAKAKIPLLLVYGDSDRVVPHKENSEVIYDRYKALGGPVERIVKPGRDHHPHGLTDPRPVIDFFNRAWAGAAADVGEPPPPGLERSLVVKGQGYFPVALRLRDGRIAVVLRGGAGHLGIKGRLDMVFSADEGKTWTRPTLVIDSPVDDRNPALGQAKDGTLVVGYLRLANYDEQGRYNPKLDKPSGTWVTRSQDGGKTWSESTQIDISDIGWGSPYGRILTLPDGTMLMPVYGGPVRKPGEKVADRDNSYLYRSADHGKTWTRYAAPGPREFNETALVRLASGKLLAAMRTRAGGEVWLTDSSDAGKSWSEPRKLTPARVHPADLILLPDQRVLLVTGYRVGPFGARGLVGDKEGSFDWARRFVLVNDAVSADCGYPSSVLLKDGRLLTVYYATGSKEHPDWGVHCGAVMYRVPG